MVVPSSSTSTGTVPAAFMPRNSGRRSHTFSTFSSTSRPFSLRATRTLRENGESQR